MSLSERPANNLLPGLTTQWLGRWARHEESVTSTNDALLRLAEQEGAPHGAVLTAQEQSAGRGRQGRRWSSPRGGLYASILLRPPIALAQLPPFSAVTALTVARALDAGGRCRTQLKWPNDVWLDGRKVAGILLETRSARPPIVIVGIGINVAAPADGWSDGLHGAAASMAECSDRRTPAQHLIAVLELLETAYEEFLRAGFAPFVDAWRERSLLTGREVAVHEGSDVYAARVDGIDEHGRLCVSRPDGTVRVLLSGEVHLRLGAP